MFLLSVTSIHSNNCWAAMSTWTFLQGQGYRKDRQYREAKGGANQETNTQGHFGHVYTWLALNTAYLFISKLHIVSKGVRLFQSEVDITTE